MQFPTKDELEQLDSPLKDYWKNEINWYWSEKLREYERWQEMTNPNYKARYLAGIRYNSFD